MWILVLLVSVITIFVSVKAMIKRNYFLGSHNVERVCCSKCKVLFCVVNTNTNYHHRVTSCLTVGLQIASRLLTGCNNRQSASVVLCLVWEGVEISKYLICD